MKLATSIAVLLFTFTYAENQSIFFSFVDKPDGRLCVTENLVIDKNQDAVFDCRGKINHKNVTVIEVTRENAPIIISELFESFTDVLKNAIKLKNFISSVNPLRVLEANAFSGAFKPKIVDLA